MSNPIKARVYKIDEKLVFCDCIIFDDNNKSILEKRQFPFYLFKNIKDLKKGSFVFIHITKEPGKLILEVMDGYNIQNSDFETVDLWNF